MASQSAVPELLLRGGRIDAAPLAGTRAGGNLAGGTLAGGARPTAILLHGDRIAWLGTDDEAARITARRTVELAGRLVTAAFVDSHVHATATGLALTGLDLSGATSLANALVLVRSYADTTTDAVILGSGWDESTWPERRAPTLAELDAACAGRAAYLTRVDVHSALASSALLGSQPSLAGQLGAPTGPNDAHVRLTAHHAVREHALGQVSAGQRRRAQQATLDRAAELGIGAVVEMAGPEVSSEEDLRDLLALARERPTVEVAAYWGELGRTDIVAELGLAGAGGDLFCDGAIGSHTAALHTPYADSESAGSGHLWLDAGQVAAHVRTCTSAGIQAGFHAIGDRAIDAVLAGVAAVADELGVAAVRELGHRIEHCEMPDREAVATMSRLGLTASVQPMFDRLWGGDQRMYAERLGEERSGGMNPYATMSAAGVPLAFGSDAPVTPLQSWAAVHAAVFHHNPAERLPARAALLAATHGGWRALRHPDALAGVLSVGAPAYLAVWEPDGLGNAIDGALSTGVVGSAESFTPPVCAVTIAAGQVVHDNGLIRG